MSTDIKLYVHSNNGATPLANNWGDLLSVLDSCLLTGYSAQQVLQQKIEDDILKLTFSSDHNFVAGQVLKITGANQPELNQEFRITLVYSSTVLHIDLPPEVAIKGISGTLNVSLPSLGWVTEYSSVGRRAYRNGDVSDTSRPYLRVVDELDPLYTTTYAKYGKVGIVSDMTDINTWIGLETPYDVNLPNKNWETTGSGLSGISGWAKWYYSRNAEMNTSTGDHSGSTGALKKWVLIGNKDWLYLITPTTISPLGNVNFFGKILLEDSTNVYGLGSVFSYGTINNQTYLSSSNSLNSFTTNTFLLHIPTYSQTKLITSEKFFETPTTVGNYYEDFSVKFIYSDIWFSKQIGIKNYRGKLPCYKFCLNPYEEVYDFRIVEDKEHMFYLRTVNGIENKSSSNLKFFLGAFNLTEKIV